jgi:hypothetical protein
MYVIRYNSLFLNRTNLRRCLSGVGKPLYRSWPCPLATQSHRCGSVFHGTTSGFALNPAPLGNGWLKPEPVAPSWSELFPTRDSSLSPTASARREFTCQRPVSMKASRVMTLWMLACSTCPSLEVKIHAYNAFARFSCCRHQEVPSAKPVLGKAAASRPCPLPLN